MSKLRFTSACVAVLLIASLVISCGPATSSKGAASERGHTTANDGGGSSASGAAGSAEPGAGNASEVASGHEGAEAGQASAVSPGTSGNGASGAEAAPDVQLSAPALKGDSQGVYAASATVSVSPPTEKARVFYTIDGSTPSAGRGVEYTGPVRIERSAVFKAVAVVEGAKPSPVASAEFTIGEVCAAQGGSGDGRRGSPLGSVAAAVAKARSIGISVVKLAAGSRFAESVEIDAPISLSGGWKPGFESRGGPHSVVAAPAAEGSAKKTPGFALRIAGAKADSGVKVERVEWRGGASQYGAGIVVADGASPQIIDCRAFGGDSSYGYGLAVLSGAAPTVRSSRLSGGLGATGYGLSVDSASVTVTASYLLAGDGSVGAYGLSATDAKVRVSSSVIAGGTANVNYGAAFYNCAGAIVEACTVDGGAGKDATAVFISSSDPALVDCVLYAAGASKSYGIVDNYGESTPSRLEAVVFAGCAGGYYYDADARAAYSTLDSSGALVTSSGKKLPRPKQMSCAKGDFSVSPSDDWKLPTGTILPSALILSGDAATDIAGRPRGAAWTIGAWEND